MQQKVIVIVGIASILTLIRWLVKKYYLNNIEGFWGISQQKHIGKTHKIMGAVGEKDKRK
ncbi:MAG: hypothetical protein ACRC6H_03010 [Culicoidibacterales bacterium]